MGCAISNFHSRIVDLSKRSNLNTDASVVSPDNLYRFLSEDNPHPKCIFIFGGTGSNKGQFIWEILEQSCENYWNNKNNEIIKLIVESDEIDFNRFRFSYYYVDLEKLIVDNLENRIQKLSGNPILHHHLDNNFVEPQSESVVSSNSKMLLDKNDSDLYDLPENLLKSSSKRRKSNPQEEALKSQLIMYANVVTNNWILSLLKKEIEDNNNGPYERIFIINLIPNRITLFKECLFLKQTPSFINFDCNYVAIKLVRHSSRRKELEIKTSDGYFDEVNNNYTNYFKLINKLLEIQVKSVEEKVRFKLSTTKNAIRIITKIDLISFIMMPKKDLLELNISEFRFDEFNEQILNHCHTTTLLFVISNEVDLDDNIKLLINDQQYDHVFLRKFIQLYRLTSYALKFV